MEFPVQEIGFGFACGLASGYTIKQIGKSMLFTGGIAFIGVQIAVHMGWIGNVNWKPIKESFEKNLDINNDGKIDKEDFMFMYNKICNVLQVGLPSTAGFGAGILLGFKI